MIAYWDQDQKCDFANYAYLEWFGRTTADMANISMKDLLGPLNEKNLPHIVGPCRVHQANVLFALVGC